jgi:ABC-type Na+ efflux pump permease subunit
MDDQTSNNSLKLERLRNEYNLTIIEYNNAYQDFMNLVNQSDVSLKKLENSKLTGVNYKTIKNSLNKFKFFKGNLVISKDNNHNSYIRNINSVYLVLSEINSKLNNIVNAINDLLNKIEPATTEELEHKREVINSLNVEYESLNNKNNKIKNLTKQNDNLTNEYNITSIMINKSVFTYFLWILILLILLFFIIKYVFYS